MTLTMQQKIEAVKAKVASCIALAESKFNVKLPAVQIRFDLKGRAAGMAGWRGSVFTGASDFYLRFNVNHMALGGQSWEHLLNDTVPHEVAHTVCQAFPQFGRNHDAGWKRVCLALGGNGKRCYSAEDAPEAVAKQRPFQYVTTSGHTVNVTPAIHKKIQFQGASYAYRGGLGKINKQCSYSLNTAATVVKKVAAPKAPTAPITLSGQMAVPAVGSNAERIRAYIKINKAIHGSEAFELAVSFGVMTLNMKRQLARAYVKNNWDKV